MGNTVTVTAFCKLFMNDITVRLAVATLAFRQLTMLGMTLGTGQSRVLCLMILQHLVSLLMTASADFFCLGNRIGDHEGCMHRMTGQAVWCFQRCHGAVVFMAFRTYRYAAMFLRMTG